MKRKGTRLNAAAKKKPPPEPTREAWLERAVDRLRVQVFRPAGHQIPALRVSCGWPAKKPFVELANHWGQCWHPDSAADGRSQVFISPVLAEAVPVLDTLAHELVHACGAWDHRQAFKRIALAIGLQGPMRSTTAGPALMDRLRAIVDDLGPYPHAALTPKPARRGSRLRLYICTCPIRVRVAADEFLALCLRCREPFRPAAPETPEAET